MPTLVRFSRRHRGRSRRYGPFLARSLGMRPRSIYRAPGALYGRRYTMRRFRFARSIYRWRRRFRLGNSIAGRTAYYGMIRRQRIRRMMYRVRNV